MRRFNADIPVGRTIVCGTNVGIHARTRALPTLLTVTSTDETGAKYGPFSVQMEAAALLDAARKGDFFSYACGVAYHMLINYRVGGLEIDNFQTDLPLKKGLSSSAAFCVLVARAFDRAYNLRLTIRGEMECAFAGERLTPSKCGRMDQACANGSRPVLMTYDNDFLDVEPIRSLVLGWIICVRERVCACVDDWCASVSQQRIGTAAFTFSRSARQKEHSQNPERAPRMLPCANHR